MTTDRVIWGSSPPSGFRTWCANVVRGFVTVSVGASALAIVGRVFL